MQVSDKLPDDAYSVSAMTLSDDQIVAKALDILLARMRQPGAAMSSPDIAKQWLRLHIGGADEERFVVLFLDVRHRLIAAETMFIGTLNETRVYPREVAKAALKHNAHSVMLSHNHPSGIVEPSDNDKALTNQLKTTLDLVGTRVLDHIIVSAGASFSFAEHGLI